MARTAMRLALCWGVLTGSACVDVRSFQGDWYGAVVGDANVRQGFAADVRVAPLRIGDAQLQSLAARLSTTDGRFTNTALTRVRKAAGDALASLSFDGDPLRSYLLFAPDATTGVEVLFIASLFSDDHVELRALRGNDLFGVFYLTRE